MCEKEKDCNLVEQVQDIHDAICGDGTHKNMGILDRINRLEKKERRNNRIVGMVAGLAASIGYIISKIKL